MNKKMLYDVNGNECFFRHQIDYQQALDTGLYFKENPVEKAEKEITEERAAKKQRRLGKQDQEITQEEINQE